MPDRVPLLRPVVQDDSANEAPGPPRARADSHVRVRNTGFRALLGASSPGARAEGKGAEWSFLAEFGEVQLVMQMSALHLDRLVDAMPRDPSALAAARSI